MWFPFHPLGYVLATTHFARGCWFMAFLAWLARVIVVRIGGAHAIRRGLVPSASVCSSPACSPSSFSMWSACYLHAHGMAQTYNAWP